MAGIESHQRFLRTAQETAARFNIPRVYQDAHEMLDTETIEVLYSIVPAYVRTNVESTAAEKGIHIFSEKPQALTMQVAHRISNAIRKAGVISTVGFRERYRPKTCKNNGRSSPGGHN